MDSSKEFDTWPFTVRSFCDRINRGELLSDGALQRRIDAAHQEHTEIDYWSSVRQAISCLTIPKEVKKNYDQIIAISSSNGTPNLEELKNLLYTLRPWRKGPFSLFGQVIDSEWKSDLKWDRIAPHLPPLSNAVIGDFGCNNGYYMFRMRKHNPRAVLGLDPNGRFFYQFCLLQQLFREPSLFFEPLGVEDAQLFPEVFDCILCLGVIYHRKDPIQMLYDVRSSLKPGGTLFLESITVPGKRGYCLFPADRYAAMRNVWFLPSPETLMDFLIRARFESVSIIHTGQTSFEEQRKTEFAHFDSLTDFLDPRDHSKTIEGYPAPERTIIKAQAPK